MMSFVGLALCFSIIAYTLAASVASGVSALLHTAFAARLARQPARRRASAYFWLRLAPATAGVLFVGLLFLPAFILFEPRNSGEQVTAAVLALTFLATLPLLRSGREARAAWQSTRARVAGWLTDAEPLRLRGDAPSCPAYLVHAPFPVVAVVGVRRPFLVVSRAVLDACSDDELAAILAHEATHVRHRDNLKRLLMLSTPDLLAGTAAARDMELRWQQASEETADDGAGAQRSLDLAAALVKVARLAQGLSAPPATMAAFCRGDDIARRVSRLTADRPSGRSGAARGPLLAGLGLASVAALTVTAGTLEQVHAVVELFVRLLQ